MCVPSLSLYRAWKYRGGRGLCDKCFGGVGVEVRVKGMCGDVLLQ